MIVVYFTIRKPVRLLNVVRTLSLLEELCFVFWDQALDLPFELGRKPARPASVVHPFITIVINSKCPCDCSWSSQVSERTPAKNTKWRIKKMHTRIDNHMLQEHMTPFRF